MEVNVNGVCLFICKMNLNPLGCSPITKTEKITEIFVVAARSHTQSHTRSLASVIFYSVCPVSSPATQTTPSNAISISLLAGVFFLCFDSRTSYHTPEKAFSTGHRRHIIMLSSLARPERNFSFSRRPSIAARWRRRASTRPRNDDFYDEAHRVPWNMCCDLCLIIFALASLITSTKLVWLRIAAQMIRPSDAAREAFDLINASIFERVRPHRSIISNSFLSAKTRSLCVSENL